MESLFNMLWRKGILPAIGKEEYIWQIQLSVRTLSRGVSLWEDSREMRHRG